MKRKYYLLALIYLFFIGYGYSQPRVNRKSLTFEKSTKIITRAKGWSYNSTLGEWLEYDNVLSSDKGYKERYKALQGKWMMAKTKQNFISLQAHEFSFNDTEYCILIVNKWKGKYKYQALERDWYEYKALDGYIFLKNEYLKILNFDKELFLNTPRSVFMDFSDGDFNESKLFARIHTAMLEEIGQYFSTLHTFPMYKSDEGDIRFYLPEKSKEVRRRFFPPNLFGGYENADFHNAYFELDAITFLKLAKFTAI